ncbi:MAG: pseudouridine synthase [Fusobacteriaceae bacterium]
MRINKYLATKGVASRREIDRLIEEKLIKVNGNLAASGEKVSDSDEIEIRGVKLEKKKEEKVYFLLNKPLQVISASSDDRGRTTVVDLIDTEERIYPVGRLDYETEGAIILTNDGDLFNKIIHPRTEVYKEYFVTVKGFLEDSELKSLEEGVELEDGITLPALIILLNRDKNQSKVLISIREGRNRQVRRMLDAVNHRVLKLKREKIGDIGVGSLAAGEYRKLNEREVAYLYSLGENVETNLEEK